MAIIKEYIVSRSLTDVDDVACLEGVDPNSSQSGVAAVVDTNKANTVAHIPKLVRGCPRKKNIALYLKR